MTDVETVSGQTVDNELEQTEDETTATDDDDDVTNESVAAGDVSESLKPLRRGRRYQQHVYNCSSCSRSFSNRRDIVTHEYMHRENPTTFCSVCNKSFSTESAYRRHAASHTRKSSSTQRRRKTCCQCSMQFDTMRQLSAHHADKHVDEKRFVCAICGSQFAWPENLKAHQRTHELDPHECDVCGRRFVDATSLRVHTRNSHGPTSDTPPQRKQHCCKLCGRSFQFDFSLRAHMKGHAQSPVAASLRWSKHFSSSSKSAMPDTASPLTKTKCVHVDSKGVIDLGMDVAETAVNEPSEIIVEVYNYETDEAVNNDQTAESLVDFSDVLDQSQTTITPHSLTTPADETQTQYNSAQSSKLVWYVKPDEQQTELYEQQQQQQQQHGDDDDDGDGDDGDDNDVNVKSTELSVPADNQHNDQLKSAAAAAAADDDNGDGDNGNDNDKAGEVHDDDDGDADVTHVLLADVDKNSRQQALQASISNELTAGLAVEPGGAVRNMNDSNNGDDEDDDDDVIDWMDVEPPRRRAAPFIFRQSSNNRRRMVRPREPFLFNCVMTDEKPFTCLTCGQCFRWEISLSIHQRLHTDGTFPNKSRGRRRGAVTSQSSVGRGKMSPAKSPVGRSCIVKHQRTSSDEDDDEFTFHVHADGPSEVSTSYSASRRQAARGRGQGRAQGRGHGQGRDQGRGRGHGGSGGKTVIKQPTVSALSANVTKRRKVDMKPSGRSGYNGIEMKPGDSSAAGCNGVGTDAVSVRTVEVKSSNAGRMMLRAAHICRECDRVITVLSVFNRHQRRAHLTTPVICQFCSVQFTSAWDLRRHCQQQHNSVDVGDVRKCRRCWRVFTDSKRLKQHYKLHGATVKPAEHNRPSSSSVLT